MTSKRLACKTFGTLKGPTTSRSDEQRPPQDVESLSLHATRASKNASEVTPFSPCRAQNSSPTVSSPPAKAVTATSNPGRSRPRFPPRACQMAENKNASTNPWCGSGFQMDLPALDNRPPELRVALDHTEMSTDGHCARRNRQPDATSEPGEFSRVESN